jgi:serine/threonine protein kinase
MDLVGQVVADRYRVVRRLGAGGMGVLFEVENTRIGRRFALKTLSSEMARKPDSLARFRREAEIVARLRHPNIVDIVDWDALPSGAPFYVMELLEGEDVAARILRGPVGWTELGQVASQAMSALAEAHRHGVLHRDLKPANLFLCRVGDGGDVHLKVLDFGLARARDLLAITNYDRPQWIGTPQYMSPEQIKGVAEPGPQADVWGMAAVLYEMATGRPAFAGPVEQLVVEIGSRHPVPVRVIRPDAPVELAEAIEAALSPALERRIVAIDDLAARVRGALGGSAPERPREHRAAKPSGSDTAADLPSSRRRVRRAWVKGALAGGAVAAVAVGAMVAVIEMTSDDDPPAASDSAAVKTALVATPTPVPILIPAPVAPPSPDAAPPPADAAPRSRAPAIGVRPNLSFTFQLPAGFWDQANDPDRVALHGEGSKRRITVYDWPADRPLDAGGCESRADGGQVVFSVRRGRTTCALPMRHLEWRTIVDIRGRRLTVTCNFEGPECDQVVRTVRPRRGSRADRAPRRSPYDDIDPLRDLE